MRPLGDKIEKQIGPESLKSTVGTQRPTGYSRNYSKIKTSEEPENMNTSVCRLSSAVSLLFITTEKYVQIEFHKCLST